MVDWSPTAAAMAMMLAYAPTILLASTLAPLLVGAVPQTTPPRPSHTCLLPRPAEWSSKLLSAPPYQSMAAADIPASFSWMSVNGTNYLTRVVTQLQPRPCGSCWAMAATSSISDRLRILTKARLPNINVSPQLLLDHPQLAPKAGSCDGGDSNLAYAFMEKWGAVDETCLPYAGVDYSAWGEGTIAEERCRTCDRFGVCKWVNASLRMGVSEYGVIQPLPGNANMLTEMQAEIMSRGPISCGMWAHSAGFENYTHGVIRDRTKYPGTTHAISVIGWGEEAGVPYWHVRNSFGTYWGEQGFFRVERGVNTFNMETSACHWGVPTVPQPLQQQLADLLAAEESSTAPK